MFLAIPGSVGTKLATVILVCAPMLAHARPDRNAYLDHSVNSVAGLVSEVRHDPQVADRFMRHFGMSKADVIAMFSKLHIAKLEEDTQVTMFSVPTGGAIRSHHAVLRKGTAVFEDADGNLVLKLRCGNPLVGGREVTALPSAPSAVAGVTTMQSLPPEILAPEAPPTDQLASLVPPDTTPDVVEAATPVTPVTAQSVTNNYVTNNSTYNTSGGGGNLGGLLVAVPIAAFLGAVIDHNHGCCCPKPAPTPEPLSVTLLGGGALGLVASARRRRA